MQAAEQTQKTMPPFGAGMRNAMPRLSKEEISARFISAEASRQSVLGMVKRFFDNKQDNESCNQPSTSDVQDGREMVAGMTGGDE